MSTKLMITGVVLQAVSTDVSTMEMVGGGGITSTNSCRLLPQS